MLAGVAAVKDDSEGPYHRGLPPMEHWRRSPEGLSIPVAEMPVGRLHVRDGPGRDTRGHRETFRSNRRQYA